MKKTIVLLFLFSICYAQISSQDFGKAFESFLTGKHEQALVISRKLYKSDPQDRRVIELYFKCLEKLIKKYEEKQDYRTALDYIKEAEKIGKGQHLKEIKERILSKSPNEILEEIKKENKIIRESKEKRIARWKGKQRQEKRYKQISRGLLWTLIVILYTLLIGYISYIIWKNWHNDASENGRP